MRWLLALLIILLAIWYFLPEPEPVPVEETFIGDQVKTLKKAESFEQQHLDAVREQQERMDKQLEDADGR